MKTKEQRLEFVVNMLTGFDLNRQNKGDVLCPLGVCVGQLQKIIAEVEAEQKAAHKQAYFVELYALYQPGKIVDSYTLRCTSHGEAVERARDILPRDYGFKITPVR